MKCPDENWLRLSIEASRQLVEKLLEYDPQAELIPTPRAAALQQQVDDLALRWYRDIDTRERAPFVGWPEEIASAGHACSKCFLELHKAWIDHEQPATFGLPYFSPSIIPATSEAESSAPEMVRSTRPLRELAERFSSAIERLEKLTLGPPPRKGTGTGVSPLVSHSVDFRSITFGGETFSFSPNQAAAMRVLYENWDRGAPEVADETVLFAIDAEAPPARLRDVFRGHPAWDTLIVAGATKGSRKLAIPTKYPT